MPQLPVLIAMTLSAGAPAPAASDAASGSASASVEAPLATPPAAGGEVQTTAPTTTTRKREPLSKRRDRKWIHRWAPERNMAELGVYGGVILPARDLELFEATLDLPRQGFAPLRRAGLDVGGRVAYLPLRFLGFELEGGAMPNKANDQRATMWTVRGHVIGQLGLWSVTPFVVVGAGALGVASSRAAVGNDVDASLHLGLGAKFYLNRYVMLRLDVRDIITARRGVADGATNTVEALLGLSFTFGRKRDHDRKPEPVVTPPPTDRDGDGVFDDTDACPDVPGEKPSGCPPEPGDRDGDGFLDPQDACPDEKGVAPDGCPDRDPDKDGVLDPDDRCPTEPETKNGFEDGDGCPDALPDEFGDLEVLEGVFFDVDKDTIRKNSREVLDKAVSVLERFKTVRVEVSGHTDSTGNREHNMELSQRRADAVKRYLVEHGIDAARIETRGAGPDEPLDSNANAGGRAKNRRIEFRVLTVGR
ncbi:MAG: OmpA family protein [Deltaproteobacteria bacterium]|nr:OmpA family protein [Deltaproteobacteria bacterium]